MLVDFVMLVQAITFLGVVREELRPLLVSVESAAFMVVMAMYGGVD